MGDRPQSVSGPQAERKHSDHHDVIHVITGPGLVGLVVDAHLQDAPMIRLLNDLNLNGRT